MNTFLLATLCLLGFLFLCGLLGALFLNWIGQGEPDVNGDPERDAGRPHSDAILQDYLARRRRTIEATIQAEVLAGNQVKADTERAALAEITGLQVWTLRRTTLP